MDISIIFINYKTAEMTNNAINSVIEKSKGFEYEIIVVDNSNDDSEFAKLKSVVGIKAKLVQANGNLGFGKGNNLGVENSCGEYLLFLNTDTLLVNNAIFEMYQFLKNNENVGAVGPNLYTKDMKPNHSFINYEINIKNQSKQNSFFSILSRKLFGRKDFNFKDKPQKVLGYICGAGLMIKRTCFEEIGGFDKDIFMYGEDTLLCNQVQKVCKKELYNVPSAKIIHFEGGSINKEVSETHARMVVDGNYISQKKICGEKDANLFILKMIKINKRKSFYAKVLGNKVKSANFKSYQIAYYNKAKELELIK